MIQQDHPPSAVGTYTTKQQLFVRYFTAILIDLAVLNLFDEFWSYVTVESFTVSMLIALLLQVLLKITLAIEHRIGEYFKQQPGTSAKVKRLFSAWAVLFGSKLVILEAVNIAFGDSISFTGPLEGLVAFIVIVVVMLAAEVLVLKFYNSLG